MIITNISPDNLLYKTEKCKSSQTKEKTIFIEKPTFFSIENGIKIIYMNMNFRG